MDKYYFISFEDLKDILELDNIEVIRNTDVIFKYKYMRILAMEGTVLDKALIRRCAEARHPYLIKTFQDGSRRNTIEYDFKNEDYSTTKRMFREMAQEKDLYIFQKDYENFKDSPEINRIYKIKGKSYYKIVVDAGAYIPELLFPYIYNDNYYNIEDEEDLEFLKDIYKQELEELL